MKQQQRQDLGRTSPEARLLRGPRAPCRRTSSTTGNDYYSRPQCVQRLADAPRNTGIDVSITLLLWCAAPSRCPEEHRHRRKQHLLLLWAVPSQCPEEHQHRHKSPHVRCPHTLNGVSKARKQEVYRPSFSLWWAGFGGKATVAFGTRAKMVHSNLTQPSYPNAHDIARYAPLCSASH